MADSESIHRSQAEGHNNFGWIPVRGGSALKYVFPGLGATADMFTGPWQDMRNAVFVEWPSYENESSIAELAQKLAVAYNISRDDVLIGVSFGGMVAAEIAQRIGTTRLFLVSSALGPHELTRFSKMLASLTNRSFISATQRIASLSPNPIHTQYARTQPEFISAMTKAIMHWNGFQGDPTSVERIHGSRDYVIRCPKQCKKLKGGHLIAISHARECVAYLQDRL